MQTITKCYFFACTHMQDQIIIYSLLYYVSEKTIISRCYTVKETKVFPLGFEPRTFRVLGERDNHYTTETHVTPRL